MRANTSFQVIVDQNCDLVNRTDRIDLQLVDKAKRRIVLLDVKCPYDESKNITQARDRNIAKYTPLKEEIQKNLPSWYVLLETISVGCLGSWSVENEPILKSIGLNAKSIRLFALASIRKCIAWSTKQWRFHNGQAGALEEINTVEEIPSDDSLSIPDA